MAPIQAAGGIVVRGSSQPLIALVQRRKDGEWVLPKGKLKRGENALAAARREVVEETGHNVFVHEFLGVISYRAGSKAKLAHFWRMQATSGAGRKPTRDIKAVQWLPLESAIEKLSLPFEQAFLRSVGAQAIKQVRMPVRPLWAARPDRPESADGADRTERSPRPQPALSAEPGAANPPLAVVTQSSRKRFLQFIRDVFSRRRPETNAANAAHLRRP